ncbi:putative aldouronate transport system substrate-binding protein [Catenibacillus scindens]|uniref:Putative aldouronate transport system substrate-binding protein n=1 Tax=Catenibacillus scindens TaxID=673271 RepID=A0A7W8HE72_9FIRM|nr:ABC transporter substrate-binding protein [Catenibacillus scindens]MBB5266052.1 putative aldouronate transport system substrate-binding protein [Catenibacillus scindens]
MLKKGRRWAALLMAAAMVSTAAFGCGNSESAGGADTGGSSAQNNEANTGADTEAAGGTEGAAAASQEDIATIEMAFYNTFIPNDENLTRIEDAINAITVPEINTEVNITVINMGQWDQQINLMISSGEQLDLMPTFFSGATAFSTLASSNQLTPLNDLLEDYGQGILETIPENYLNTTTIDGNIVAVPIYKDNVGKLYYAMRTDILEELGLTEQAQNIRSMQDVEEILRIVKEKTDLIPIGETAANGVIAFQGVMVTGDFEDAFFYDRLINDYIVSANDDPETVVSLYDLEEYKEATSLFNSWFKDGLVNQDATTAEQHAEYHIAEGNTFSTFFAAETSTKNAFVTKAQYPVTIIEVCDTPLSTSTINTLTWTIPVTSKEPEAAMEFLNLMYTDERIVNLLNYGQEDVDYVVKEDGTFAFPEGVDISSSGYHFETSWLFGNQFLAGVWEGDEPTLREEALTINENATYSPIFGFAASSAGMDTQLAGILSAFNEYANSLQCGAMDVETNLPAFQEKLKAAGIDDVVANVQGQLDAWLAENGGEGQ